MCRLAHGASKEDCILSCYGQATQPNRWDRSLNTMKKTTHIHIDADNDSQSPSLPVHHSLLPIMDYTKQRKDIERSAGRFSARRLDNALYVVLIEARCSSTFSRAGVKECHNTKHVRRCSASANNHSLIG